jgi:multidrug efflux pump subunit AcrA (membrane-fusion protein)
MRYANSLVLLATALFVLGTAGCGSDPNADQSAAENPAMGQPGHDHEAMLAEMAAAAAENPAMGEPGHDHEAMLAEMAAADHADHDSMADSDAMNMPRQGSSAMQSASDQSESVDHSAHQMTPATGATGGIVSIEPSVVQTIGVRTTTVEVRSLSREIRSTGRFEMDESGIHTVTVRTPGWIEALHVDYEGALVTKGQPLLDLYSPDLVATQEEYLLAFRNAQRMSASPIEGMAKDAERLLSAARGRLILWEITEDQIAELERTGKPMRTVRFNVPATGEVMRKSVTEGQHVQAGEPLLVDHVYYMLDTKTRTARARIIMPGQRQVLKPGMYATVRIQSKPLAPAPVVPEEAVIRTGEQDVVIVDLGDGQFAPTVVRIGILAEGSYQILHGLSGGERIVTRAQFLIDSESRLKSAVGAMTGHSH